LSAFGDGWNKNHGYSIKTERKDGLGQEAEVKRHNGEAITNKPAVVWERELLKIEGNESQQILVESKYFKATYEKGHEAVEVKVRAVANSEELSLDATASIRHAEHKISASGGIENLHGSLELEALSYYGEAKASVGLNEKGFKAELGLGAGAHLIEGQAKITLESPSLLGVKMFAECSGNAGVGVEGYLGASAEVSSEKVEVGVNVGASLGVGAHAACSVGLGFDN